VRFAGALERFRVCEKAWSIRTGCRTFLCVTVTAYYHLRQGGYVFARVCLSFCLSVCLCVNKITQKVMEGSFWNFQGMSGMAKTTSGSILGGWSGRNPRFCITLKFSSTLLSMGHRRNPCQTEYGAATWRTTRRWRRSAVSDCFSSYRLQFRAMHYGLTRSDASA